MKKALLSIFLLAMAVGWAVAIYKLSDMNSQKSNGKSVDFIAIFIEDTLDVTNEYGITNSHPTDSKLEKVSQLINAPMRKVMHATVYLVLAFFVILFLNVLMNNKHYWISLFLALIVCVIYASADELHQLNVQGRTGQPLDVLIDIVGSLVGIFLYSTYYIVYKNGYKRALKEIEENKKSI